jgi:uncharacterized spore protein YtfJ
MQVQELLAQARDTLTVKRVYGEPYEKNGVTVIPAAAISGGGGGGKAEVEEGEKENESAGGGFGLGARPVGAFVIRGDEATWVPAIDVNRVILGGQIVAIVLLLMLRGIARMRSRERLARIKAMRARA